MRMTPDAAELWEVASRTHFGWRVAVLTEHVSLATRVADALEREGLIETLDVVGGDLSGIEAAGRRPTMLVIEAPDDQHELERTLEWAGNRLPGAVVLVVLASAQRFDLGRLLSLGADGVVLERGLDTALGPAARAAAAGQISVPAELRLPIQRPALSHRERQMLGLAVAGLTNAQIASRMFISESTVKTHLSAAFRRLGVRSRREAAALIVSSDEVLRRSVLGAVRLSGPLASGADRF
jgi:DNA-binding NarL/FixJ family response regulator